MASKRRVVGKIAVVTVLVIAGIGLVLSGATIGEILDPGADNPSEGPSLTEWEPQLVNSSTIDTYQVEITADNAAEGISMIRQRPQVNSQVTQRINMNESFGDAMNPQIVAFEGDDGPQERIEKDIFIDNGDVVVELADTSQGAQQQARLTSITVEFEVESAPNTGLYNFSVDMEAQETLGPPSNFETLSETGVAQVEVVDANPAGPEDFELVDIETVGEAPQDETQLAVTGTVENPTGDALEGSVIYGLAEDADPAFDGTDLLTQQQNITIDANSQETTTFFVDLTAEDEAINTGDDIRHGIQTVESESNLTQSLGITDGPIQHSADAGETVNRTTGLIQTAVDISSDTDDDVVTISSGVYGENVTVGVNNVEIQGEQNGDRPAVAWAGPQIPDGDVNPPFTVLTAENTTIANLQIEPLIPNAGGIEVLGGMNHTVTDIDMEGTNTGPPGSGITLIDVTEFEISDATIANKSVGVDLFGSDSGIVTNNTIQNNAEYGIRMDGSETVDGLESTDVSSTDNGGNTIADNDVNSNNGYGIYVLNADATSLLDNDASNNDAGLVVENSTETVVADNNASANGFGGIGVISDSSNTTVVNNTASDNGVLGIDIFQSSSNVVRDNTVAGNGEYGVGVISSSENEFVENIIRDNGNIGILVTGSGGELEPVSDGFELAGDRELTATQAASGNVFTNDTLSGHGTDVVLDNVDADFVDTTLDTAELSGTPATDVAFVAQDNPPEGPAGLAAVENTFLDIVNTTEAGSIDLTLAYEEANVIGSQATLDLYRYNETEGEWELVPSDVDTANNTVSAELDLTEASTFGVFSDPPSETLSDLDIANEGESAVIADGAERDVTVNVTNFGQDNNEIDVNLTIGNDIELTETTQPLNDGETETVVFENVTSEFAISFDAYPVDVSTEDDSLSGDLRVHPDVNGDGEPARDTTGDGLLNDINGDGEFSIADVQMLFDFLNSDVVQDNSAFFDFAGVNPDRVSVFDIQALFTQLQADSN